MFKSFFRLLARCYKLALPYGRMKLFAVLGLIFFNGLLQLVGVTSIFPFFALAADPERIRRSSFGAWLLHFLPPLDANHLLVVAGSFAIGMLLISSAGSMVSEMLRISYAYGLAHWLRGRVFESYAGQTYGYFLQKNSAELCQKLWDIQTFTQNVLLPVGEIMSRIVLVLFLVAGVFIVQPWIALGAALIFGGFYFMVFIWLRPRTRAVGDGLQQHGFGFAKNTYQFLHGIKTVLVHGKSRQFIERAMIHSAAMGRFQVKIPLYGNGPRYLIEPIAFGGLVAIVVVLALQGRPFSDILPNLSVIALAGYRLLPSLQTLYGQLVNVASNNYTLRQLEDEIGDLEEETKNLQVTDAGIEGALEFEHEIQLENITFQYRGATQPILRDFCLTIAKNESLGIAGVSGSGKSTLVDLLLGLHVPDSGRILIDGKLLCTSNLPSWRAIIGYVPQEIYLTDDTIEANIAFGLNPEDIDATSVREAAHGAQILNFIESELPDGFKTTVGERGVRLSGGQRQRIGLARALYHKPQILILDEATSALDHQTELSVMETIHQLQGKLTILTIAHRLSTLERCDRVIQLSKKQ